MPKKKEVDAYFAHPHSYTFFLLQQDADFAHTCLLH